MAVLELGSEALEQRRRAIRRAMEVRTHRARLTGAIREGETTLPELLRTPPWWIETEEIETLLRRQRGVGGQRARKLLWRERIRTNKQVGEMTERQRLEVANAVESW